AGAPPIALDKPAAKTAAGKSKEKPAQKAPPKPAKPAEPELEREQEYELVLEQEQLVPAYDQTPPEPPAPAQNKAAAPPAGSAFRDMGLLEEAISEFQKVAKASDNGRAFRYTMQCCTLLGLAFMEKGQPAIAAIWYERALHTPGIDPESTLALRYDLGVAQE